MKPQDMQRYAKVVSDVINATEENGEDLNADYETLRNAIDHDTIADLSGDKLKAIKDHFQARTKTVFEIVEAARKRTDVPIVFLTYLNIVFKYGYDAFCKKCQELDISGLVIPDMPYESREDIVPTADKYGIDIIPLIAPTSGHRVEKIAKAASGFIYVVSSLGITGTKHCSVCRDMRSGSDHNNEYNKPTKNG